MKTFNDLIQFQIDNQISLDTPVIVPYRRSYFSETNLLYLIVFGNSLFATNNKTLKTELNLLTIGNIINRIKPENQTMLKNYHGSFLNNNSIISPSLFLDNIFRTGGSEVVNFVYKDDAINLDVIF